MEVGVATQSSDCKQKRSLFPCLFFPFFLDNTQFSSTSISYFPTSYFPAQITSYVTLCAFQLSSLLLPYPNFLLSNFLLHSANNYPALIKFVKHTVSNFAAFQLLITLPQLSSMVHKKPCRHFKGRVAVSRSFPSAATTRINRVVSFKTVC